MRSSPILVLSLLVSCSPKNPPAAQAPYSNILKEDYVGPDACAKCHKGNHASWQQHPHSRMNARAGLDSVLGDFSGVRVAYGDGHVVFRKQDDRHLVDYFRKDALVRTFQLTRTIGWRYLQEYAAVQVQGPESPDDLLYREETRLKWGWQIREKRWIPQSYHETPYFGTEYTDDGTLRYDPFEPERSPFNNRCVHCHNTFPYELRLYTDQRLHGFPEAPESGIASLLRGRPQYAAQRDNPTLPRESLVTIGISCETCHFGGREHVRDPKKPPRFVPTHPELAGWTPDHVDARKNPLIVNSLCRQCHFSGESAWADGSAVHNSMESIEQDRGACLSRLRCIDCHNPHVKGADAGMSERPEAVAACFKCHGNYGSTSTAKAHARHDPARVSCLDCHMPRIVHGFNGMNRTHRIASPTEPVVLASGMPNACNLCHLDKSLAWTRDELAKGWNKRVELPALLEEHFGAAHARPTGDAWLTQPMGMLRVVAAWAYARSADPKAALPRLYPGLDDPNAYVRMRSLQVVEQVLGRKLTDKEYRLTATPGERAHQVRQLLK